MNGTNQFKIYGETVDGNCLYSEIIRNLLELPKDWKIDIYGHSITLYWLYIIETLVLFNPQTGDGVVQITTIWVYGFSGCSILVEIWYRCCKAEVVCACMTWDSQWIFGRELRKTRLTEMPRGVCGAPMARLETELTHCCERTSGKF